MIDFAGEFTNTCVPLGKGRCVVQEKFLDPCSCTSYYECIVGHRITDRVCANGTAYKHVGGFNRCVMEDEVYLKGICNPATPWQRCNVTDDRMLELQKYCMPSSFATDSPPNTTTITSPYSKHIDTDQVYYSDFVHLYMGYIIGGAIAFICLSLLVIILLIQCRRKRSKRRLRLSHRRLVLNPEYSTNSLGSEQYEDEIYSIIYDRLSDTSRFKHPLNNNPPLPARPVTVDGRKVSSQSESFHIRRHHSHHYGTENHTHFPPRFTEHSAQSVNNNGGVKLGQTAVNMNSKLPANGLKVDTMVRNDTEGSPTGSASTHPLRVIRTTASEMDTAVPQYIPIGTMSRESVDMSRQSADNTVLPNINFMQKEYFT